jgi:hypothetical protein
MAGGEGRTDRQRELPVSAAFAIDHTTNSQTFARGVPPVVQRRVSLPIGARLRRRGGVELHPPG